VQLCRRFAARVDLGPVVFLHLSRRRRGGERRRQSVRSARTSRVFITGHKRCMLDNRRLL
jgi:hypothetical protein